VRRLEGRIAIITGSAAGYGEGVARRFAQEGAQVVVADYDGDAAVRKAAKLTGGPEALGVRCDVGRGESVKAMVDEVVGKLGGFDILVNNAGATQRPSRLARTPEADIDRMWAVNVKSLYYMSVHAFPVLRKRGGGTVINIASVAALRPRPGMTWYNATKGAVITITMAMAAELAPDKIRVNAIAPAVGRTQMFDQMYGAEAENAVAKLAATMPLGRLCEPDDVAGAAAFLASSDAQFITGIVLPVDGGRLIG
jgi:3-oxoacyl-[acyl-carrier protein] reductase